MRTPLAQITEQKAELMQKSHVIVASAEERWGLIVSHANDQGTPAVVDNVDGLRDNVRHGGITTDSTPEDLFEGIDLLLRDKEPYRPLQSAARAFSRNLRPKQSYRDLLSAVSQS